MLLTSCGESEEEAYQRSLEEYLADNPGAFDPGHGSAPDAATEAEATPTASGPLSIVQAKGIANNWDEFGVSRRQYVTVTVRNNLSQGIDTVDFSVKYYGRDGVYGVESDTIHLIDDLCAQCEVEIEAAFSEDGTILRPTTTFYSVVLDSDVFTLDGGVITN